MRIPSSSPDGSDLHGTDGMNDLWLPILTGLELIERCVRTCAGHRVRLEIGHDRGGDPGRQAHRGQSAHATPDYASIAFVVAALPVLATTG